MTIGAAILAGGQARRYAGRDKGAILVDGRTIRDRQIAELASLVDSVLIVGVPADSSTLHQDATGASIRIRAVRDRIAGCGPLGGIHTALLESTADALLVIACDMPYISAAMLRYLASLTCEADLVVPRTDRGYHPLCAAYTPACRGPVARRVADGRLKMTDLFEDVRVRVVDAGELGRFGDVERLLANVNSPDDHRRLEANKQ